MCPAPVTSETLTRTDAPGRCHGAPGSLPPLPAGATLGRYVVTHVLGEGGMGVVYAAHDFVLDRRVAVKLVRPDLDPAEREARKARLVSEAQAVARLSHPNVIAVYDVGEFGGELYIAMELVPGQTLEQWLRAGPRRRSLEEILESFVQAGRGLAAAHRAGLVHRDFKPHNVLVGADGRVRVTDFGLAVAQGTPVGDGSGTPAYMAPEQALGRSGPLADQYSFAVTLHEAVLGVRPGQPDRGTRVPRWLREVLARALLPAERRFASMEELLATMERLRRSPGRSRRLAAGALGAGLAAGMAIAAAVLSPGAVPPPDLAVAVHQAPPPVEISRPLEASAGARPALAAACPSPPPVASTTSWPSVDRRPLPEADPPRPVPGESPDRSLLAALERLVGTLRDLGFVDDAPPRRPAPASAPDPGRGGPGGGDGTVWVPMSRTAQAGPAPSFFAAPRPARTDDVEGPQVDTGHTGETVELAEARFALAQALWDSNQDRDRALRLAQQAQAALMADGRALSPELLSRITEWIQLRHPLPK